VSSRNDIGACSPDRFGVPPSQYRHRAECPDPSRVKQPLTRLAALGDLSPLRGARCFRSVNKPHAANARRRKRALHTQAQ